MEITPEILRKSTRQECFGTAFPFDQGDEHEIENFYKRARARIQRTGLISVFQERDHHGSGYASYISVFLYPRNGSTVVDKGTYIEKTGILLYFSRMAPIAVFGRSARTDDKNKSGSGSGFISAKNLNQLPDGDWRDFMYVLTRALTESGIELLPTEPLLKPAPEDLDIPTVFDPPYYVFDALFYWAD